MLLTAQERGMKPVQVRIEGTPTTLYQQSHALLIGISDYTKGWNSLPGVNRDIPRLKEALEKHGFQVEVVMNPSNKDALDNAFSDFISKYGNSRDNRLLVYYAGHGYTIKTDWGGELGYIVSADAPLPSRDNSSPFQRKAMEMAQIDIYAKRIQSKHALFIFDACFAGSIFTEDRSGVPEYISYNTAKPVRQFITSGSADETVADISFFCDQFIEALDGKADYDKDGYITGSELGYFLKKEVIQFSNNRQHPQSGKINDSRLDDGDFVFEVISTNTATTPVVIEPVNDGRKNLQSLSQVKDTSYCELYFCLNDYDAVNYYFKLKMNDVFVKELTHGHRLIYQLYSQGTVIISDNDHKPFATIEAKPGSKFYFQIVKGFGSKYFKLEQYESETQVQEYLHFYFWEKYLSPGGKPSFSKDKDQGITLIMAEDQSNPICPAK